MTLALTILYYSLSLAILSIAAAVWYVAFFVVKTLQSTKPIIREMEDITHDVQDIKNTVKYDIVNKTIQFIRLFTKK